MSPLTLTPASVHHNAWFPGRFIGGGALVLGPLLWFAGLTLRHLAQSTAEFTPQQQASFDAQPFAAPEQLAAYALNPALATAGYACYTAGAIVLCLAVVVLARVAAARCPWPARLGGAMVVVGLFSRLYWAGVDETALQLIGTLGLERTTELVMHLYGDVSYGPWRVPVSAAFGLYIGTVLLGWAAFRSGTFGTGRLVLFLFSGWLWTGVLKESELVDGVLSGAALCLVLVPLGIKVLRDAVPELRTRSEPAADRARLRLVSW
ncbi:hypothetical protein E1295_18255 [Nonomuraea mesophila]|uniref:DUF4386 family protein n=1 Tax=Nonomuraea mesophila TaxID=2530382 RepID=A0A4R5FII0_9ACTN|nr:hypothetical protein [Nonomuraea mesophila]TDE51547.1 hypothetical protein E1295_18255 [Nonomuraea mesophila]